jgi:hypothetical protein
MLAPSYITRTVYIFLLPCTQFLSKMQIIRHVLKTGKKTVGLISTYLLGRCNKQFACNFWKQS